MRMRATIAEVKIKEEIARMVKNRYLNSKVVTCKFESRQKNVLTRTIFKENYINSKARSNLKFRIKI